MAKKSKTQRAKASAKRAEKKVQPDVESEESLAAAKAAQEEPREEKKESKNPLKKFSRSADTTDTASKQPAKADRKAAKDEKPAKKSKPAGFFKEVRAEMKRVTWPSRQDIVRWSGVVVVALVFFGLFVFVLDNWVVTPLLLAISTLGA